MEESEESCSEEEIETMLEAHLSDSSDSSDDSRHKKKKKVKKNKKSKKNKKASTPSPKKNKGKPKAKAKAKGKAKVGLCVGSNAIQHVAIFPEGTIYYNYYS